jgi:Flp pilus assembly protein TadG
MKKDERGQSLTEFALVLPIFLLLVCGIFDFGRLMYTYMNMNNAAQESVRKGGLGEKDADIKAFAKSYVRIGDASVLVTITPPDTVRHSGDYVTVKLEYPFKFITPLVSKFLPSPNVQASSTIRVE